MNGDQLRREAQSLSPNEVCAAFLALNIVEHSYMPTSRIAIQLDLSGATITDTGRGMRLTPDRGDTLSHAERALTSIYPCLPSSPAVEATLRELIWGARGPVGPALANFACPCFQFISERDGEIWSQTYRYGLPTGAATLLGPTRATGTTVKFETAGPIDRAGFAALIDRLTARIPSLVITLV